MKKRYNISDINKSKYLYAPSWEHIQQFLNELGIKMYHFEKFYNVPFNTLTQIKSGSRNLPSGLWGIIYDRIKPTYGSGFLYDYTENEHNNRINNRNNNITQNLTNSVPKRVPTKKPASHDRLTTLK